VCSHIVFFTDDDDSAELDAIISELRDFKIQFEECSNLSSHQQSLISKNTKMEHSTNHPISSTTSSSSSPSTSSSTNGCVYELRTLEDQLEAALASLTLTINDCTNIDSQQQRSSGSSACSSGLGAEITNDSLNLYNLSNTNHQTTTSVSFTSKMTTTATDDCDSAFSDSGSTDKVSSPNHDESVRIEMTSQILND
jgi:hypothetical protein